MTTKFKIVILSLAALLLAVTVSYAQIPDEIIVSLNTGNAARLSKSFNQNVELVVLDNDNVYSKAQAEQVIGDFFKNNPPVKFSIVHQGGKGDSKFAIGTLQTAKERFRVYFLLKTRNNMDYIHQLRIEKQNE
jgi:hypothetical protein